MTDTNKQAVQTAVQKILTDYGKEFTPPLDGNDLFHVHEDIIKVIDAYTKQQVREARIDELEAYDAEPTYEDGDRYVAQRLATLKGDNHE